MKGVASTTINKLQKAGYTTVKAVAVTPARELVERTGMGLDTALKVSKLARERVDLGYVPALEILERRRQLIKCTTGSDALDELLVEKLGILEHRGVPKPFKLYESSVG